MTQPRYSDSPLPGLLKQQAYAIKRIQELGNALAFESPSTSLVVQEALLFNLESAAWASIELGKFWIYEERLGIPKKENEVFDFLARLELLPVDRARKLRYIAEWRNASSRVNQKIDWNYLQGDLSLDLLVMKEWAETVQKRFDAEQV